MLAFIPSIVRGILLIVQAPCPENKIDKFNGFHGVLTLCVHCIIENMS